MGTNKKILFVTFNFPPLRSAGVSRIVRFCKYLPQFGWDPFVLTVNKKSAKYFNQDDVDLKSIGIDENKVYRTPNINIDILFSISRIAKIIPRILPDNKLGWYPFALIKGILLVKKENIKIIFVSLPPHSTYFLAKSISIICGIKLVVDFRDQWYAPLRNKSHFVKKINKYIERKILDSTDHFTCISEYMVDEFNAESSKSFDNKFNFISSGFDVEEYRNLQFRTNNKFTIIYTGSFYGGYFEIELFLRILSELHTYNLIHQNNFLFKIITKNHRPIQQLINNYNLSGIIDLHGSMPHETVLQEQINSNALFFTIKYDERPGIYTSKIYEYIYSGKPIIAIAPKENAAAKLLNRLNYDSVYTINEEDGIKSKLKFLIKQWESDKLTKENSLNYIKEFDTKIATSKLAKLFDLIANNNWRNFVK